MCVFLTGSAVRGGHRISRVAMSPGRCMTWTFWVCVLKGKREGVGGKRANDVQFRKLSGQRRAYMITVG